MSARSVCSGTRPSRYHSRRAISAPFRRPDAHDLDALRAEAHRVLHRALHRAAEHDPLLELLRDRVGDELRVDLGLADLLDVEADVAAHHLAQVGAQRLDVLALLADDDAGPRAVDRDARVLRRPLDRDLARPTRATASSSGTRGPGCPRRAVVAKFLLFANHFDVQLRLTARRNPVGWIFCPMVCSLLGLAVADGDVDVAALLADHVAAALGARGSCASATSALST